MAMCIPSYPQVLAYSFLEELAGEFTKKYDRYKVEQALRPYNLIEFGKLYSFFFVVVNYPVIFYIYVMSNVNQIFYMGKFS